MSTVRWFDTLRLVASAEPGISLRVVGAPDVRSVPADGSNLVVRSLRALQEAARVPSGAEATLVKRIPSQAGLGGGSSDAAAALVAGNQVWRLGWTVDRLAELAATLGSDVPFFVHAIATRGVNSAIATGRGERVRSFASRSGGAVVVLKPPKGLSTPEVYGACEGSDYLGRSGHDRCDETADCLRRGAWGRLAGSLANGLQPAALRLAPWLESVRAAFAKSRVLGHQLSGSGSAYFGLVPSMAEARRVAARLRAFRIGQVAATTFG